MGTVKKNISYFFESRLKVGGDRGEDIRKIVEKKQKREHRKTYADTIEAIILEYGDIESQKQ